MKKKERERERERERDNEKVRMSKLRSKKASRSRVFASVEGGGRLMLTRTRGEIDEFLFVHSPKFSENTTILNEILRPIGLTFSLPSQQLH